MTTNERPSIMLSERQVFGKKVKTLRRAGIVPVHYYGKGAESMSLQADAVTLRKALREVGANIPIQVNVEGQDQSDICFVREVQWHPVDASLLHVDFMRLDITERVAAEVPITIIGQSAVVRDLGGVLILPFQTLPVEALPFDMPKEIVVDITPLEEFGDSIRVGEFDLGEGVDILRSPDDMLAAVQEPRVEEEEVEEEEDLEGELGEGEEGAEADDSEDAGAPEGT